MALGEKGGAYAEQMCVAAAASLIRAAKASGAARLCRETYGPV